jgi:replicative DNA helicase
VKPAIEAEQALLGALMVDAGAVHRVRGHVAADDFTRADHRQTFRAIVELCEASSTPDPVTVAERLEAAGELDRAGGLPYLVELAENTPNPGNADGYAAIVRERSHSRAIAEACSATIRALSNGTSAPDATAELQARLEDLARRGLGRSWTWIDVLAGAEESIRRAGDRELLGIPTGFEAIDQRIGGLPPGRLLVIAAATGKGKTALAEHFALNAAAKGYAVGVCSLEMSATELGIRALANRFEVNGTGLAFGNRNIAAELWQRFTGSDVMRYRIFIDDETYALAGCHRRSESVGDRPA